MDYESPDVIEAKMAETRQSLTDKVAALEETVVGTVQSVKTAVDGTVESVKDSVNDALDWKKKIREHPLMAVGVAAIAGFMVCRAWGRKAVANGGETPPTKEMSASPTASPEIPRAFVPPITQTTGHVGSVFDVLLARAGDELKKIGEVAIERISVELQRTVDDTVPRIVDKLKNVPEMKLAADTAGPAVCENHEPLKSDLSIP
ncbi:MAG: hypothetical protein U0798_08615 [Gemmataceae bacterium]